jgi:hypothetical protein
VGVGVALGDADGVGVLWNTRSTGTGLTSVLCFSDTPKQPDSASVGSSAIAARLTTSGRLTEHSLAQVDPVRPP